MRCTNCNEIVKEGTKYCENCGAKIEWPAAADGGQETEPAGIEETIEPAEAAEPEVKPAELEEAVEPEEKPAEPEEKPAEPEEKPAEPVREKPKKKNRIWLIALLVLIAAAGGFLVYQNMPETKYKKAMAQAETMMEQENYEEAIKGFEQAFAIRTPDADASFRASEAYCMYLEKLLAEDRMQEIVDTAAKAETVLLEEDLTVIRGYGQDAYQDLIIKDVINGEYDAAREKVQKATDEGYSFPGFMEGIDAEEKHAEFIEKQKTVLQEIALLLDGKDYEAAMDRLNEDMLAIRTEERKYGELYAPILAEPASGLQDQIGLYDQGGFYAVYYGDAVYGFREGEGVYLIAEKDIGSSVTFRYYAIGEWENDAPSGMMEEHRNYYKDDTVLSDIVIRSTVKDGLYNGEVTRENDGVSYKGTYENGVARIIDETDPNGDPYKVFMYNSDKTAWLYFADDAGAEMAYGMLGYGAQ